MSKLDESNIAVVAEIYGGGCFFGVEMEVKYIKVK